MSVEVVLLTSGTVGLVIVRFDISFISKLVEDQRYPEGEHRDQNQLILRFLK